MDNSPTKIAVFASGSGTNAENIVNYFRKSSEIDVVLIVSNLAKAKVLLRAKRLEVPSLIIQTNDIENPDSLLAALKDWEIDWIVLAGFLKKIPSTLIEAYNHKIINIHPALLPKYGGKGMYGDKVHEAVVQAGDNESGITIHEVNEVYDEGPIIFQAKCSVKENDTAKDIAQKVHELEYKHYPKVIEKLILGK